MVDNGGSVPSKAEKQAKCRESDTEYADIGEKEEQKLKVFKNYYRNSL